MPGPHRALLRPASSTRSRSAACSTSIAAGSPIMGAFCTPSQCSAAGGTTSVRSSAKRTVRHSRRNKSRLPEAAARGTADSKPPLVWLLMGTRAGDNNQLHALVDALGWPFEDKRIRYNALRHFRFLRSGLTIVARKSRPLIHSPWPDLVLCVGYGSVPVARYIRGQTGGRAKLVHIGNPRDKVRDFDLQITNPKYARAAPNLLELPFPIGN